MENISAFLTGLAVVIAAIGTVIIVTLKTYKATKKELDTIPHKIRKQTSIDILITDKMEEIKDLLNADRVQIYDFHNGGHYANGRSALKTSCTYEICRTGIKPAQPQLQSIPLSCIAKFINELLNNGELEIKDLEEIKNTMPATYQLKKGMQVKSFFDIVLNNKYGEPVGFLAVQYVDNEYGIQNISDKQEILRLKFFVEEQLEKMKEGR